MDTKLATAKIRIRQWAEIIKDRCDSGMTVDVYCEKHGLSRNSYFYWLRKVRQEALFQAESGTRFIELSEPGLTRDSVPEDPSLFLPQLTVQLGDAVIGIDNSTPMELLSRTLEVVRSAQ